MQLALVLGDEEDTTSEPNWGMDCSKVVRVKELHISSPILAAKSPFFYKVSSMVLLIMLLIFMCISLLIRSFLLLGYVIVVLQWNEGI